MSAARAGGSSYVSRCQPLSYDRMSVPLEAAEHAGLTFTSLLRGEAGAEEDALRMDRHAPRLCGMACEEK